MPTIKVLQNGPYLVDGDAAMLVDWNALRIRFARDPLRCTVAASTTKPFCNGRKLTSARTGSTQSLGEAKSGILLVSDYSHGRMSVAALQEIGQGWAHWP